MNLVDSSGWLEYFVGGPHADFFVKPIQDTSSLLVPTIVIYEVFRRTLQLRGEDAALEILVQLRRGRVVEFDEELALASASVGVMEKLPLADSIIFATAMHYGATIWTMDQHFAGKADVRFIAKSAST
jgi:predicted nucleic acid-binding protein